MKRDPLAFPRLPRSVATIAAVVLLWVFMPGTEAADSDSDGLTGSESSDIPGAFVAGAGVSLDLPTDQVVTNSVVGNDEASWRWHTYWQEGLYFSLEHDLKAWRWGLLVRRERTERFAGKIGVRVEVDAGVYDTAANTSSWQSSVALRRFRLYSEGEFPLVRPVYYKVEAGLVEDRFQLNDVYFWIKEIPLVDTFKFGHFKTPMSLAGYGSSRDSVGMELSSVIDAFQPGSKLGFQLGKAGQARRYSWAAGVFFDGGDQERGDASESGGRAIGRFTFLPWYHDDEGDVFRMIHLGASANYTFSDLSNVRYRARPESFLAPVLVDTGDLGVADSAWISGVEFAQVVGPISVQAEYMFSDVTTVDGQRAFFDGAYVLGSWILTGESRPYRQDIGVFDRIVPERSFSLVQGGVGAVELFGRVSYVDLEDGPVDGGRMALITGGVNWYWSRTVKLRLNYTHADVKGGATPGRTHILQTRLQLAF